MAFKVGQQVKRVRDPLYGRANETLIPIGAVGVVMKVGPDLAWVCTSTTGPLGWGCQPDTLAPLTDPGVTEFLSRIQHPKAAEFIEGLKKLAREPRVVQREKA